MRGTSSADEFHRLVPPRALVALPASFSSHDAAEAGSSLLAKIRAILESA
jgi:hypothetical protein